MMVAAEQQARLAGAGMPTWLFFEDLTGLANPVGSFPEMSVYSWPDLTEREFHFDDPDSSHTQGPGSTV
jgi:hypothetical protein